MNTLKKVFQDVAVCCECGEITRQVTSGDEGWTYCDGCGTIEGSTKLKYICPDCEELCDDEKCDCTCSCGVPHDLHSTTMCGWDAALMPSNEFGVINDRRHPGYGKPFMSWNKPDSIQFTNY
jgi:hypothetical protein